MKYLLIIILAILIFSAEGCLFNDAPHQPSIIPIIDSLDKSTASSDRFTLVGSYLCAATNSTIKFYNIQNPALPMHLKDVDMGTNVLSLRNYKDSLLVEGDKNGLDLYKIIASVPIRIGIFSASQYYNPLSFNSNYIFLLQEREAYLANHYPDFLNVFQVNNTSSPKLNYQKNLRFPRDLANDSNNNLFVCDSGLKVFDVADILNINLKKHFNVEADKITAYNDNLFIMGYTGLFQYRYASGSLNLLSKIPIVPTP